MKRFKDNDVGLDREARDALQNMTIGQVKARNDEAP